jgi:8-oxo-dGTP diphosphatase
LNADGSAPGLTNHLPEAAYPIHPRVAVGAVVIHDRRVLLVKRRQPPAKDTWAIPGGSVLLGETLQAAAQREIMEETGLKIRAGEPVLTFELIERDPDGRVRFHYVIVDLIAQYLGGDITAGDDVSDARFVSAAEMAHIHVNPRTRRLLESHFGF